MSILWSGAASISSGRLRPQSIRASILNGPLGTSTSKTESLAMVPTFEPLTMILYDLRESAYPERRMIRSLLIAFVRMNASGLRPTSVHAPLHLYPAAELDAGVAAGKLHKAGPENRAWFRRLGRRPRRRRGRARWRIGIGQGLRVQARSRRNNVCDDHREEQTGARR